MRAEKAGGVNDVRPTAPCPTIMLPLSLSTAVLEFTNQSSSSSNTEFGNAGKERGRAGNVVFSKDSVVCDEQVSWVDPTPAKLADRPDRVMVERGEGEVIYAERGEEELPAGLDGPNEVCKNFGTSLPKNFEDLLPLLVEADACAGLKAVSGVSWLETLLRLRRRALRASLAVSDCVEVGFDGETDASWSLSLGVVSLTSVGKAVIIGGGRVAFDASAPGNAAVGSAASVVHAGTLFLGWMSSAAAGALGHGS